MTSPVFPIPLTPRQPDSSEFALPRPRGHRECSSPLFDDTGTPLTVGIEDRGGVYRVHADGEVDIATSPLLDGALDAALASGHATVVVDLRRVTFVDCTAIGLLARARYLASRQGARLLIVPGRAVARTAALLDLTVALGLHETLPAELERSA